MESKLKQIARVFHFTPIDLSLLCIDGDDLLSVDFWYEDAIAYEKEMVKRFGFTKK